MAGWFVGTDALVDTKDGGACAGFGGRGSVAGDCGGAASTLECGEEEELVEPAAPYFFSELELAEDGAGVDAGVAGAALLDAQLVLVEWESDLVAEDVLAELPEDFDPAWL